MASVGDTGGRFTWMRYRRWPLFGLILAVLGAVLGLIIGGFIYLLIGAAAGMVLGFVIGFLMGKDKNMFPVEIEVWLTYASGDFGLGGKYPGRVTTKAYSGESGSFVERRVVEYLAGSMLRQLPNFSLPVWFKDGETRKLKVLQTDSRTFLPITVQRGSMVAHDVPVYEKDAEGKILRYKVDASGKAFEKDAEGKLIPDVNGWPLTVGLTKETIFDPNVMFEEEKGVTAIPKGLAAKMDNERVQYTQAYRIASEFNKMQGWWAQYGKLLLDIISIAVILVIVIFGLIKFQEAAGTFADKTSAAVLQASASNLEAAKLNTQVMQALVKIGFNYNFTAVVGASPTPIPVAGAGGKLNIPFVTG